jgi:hypothetical protein
MKIEYKCDYCGKKVYKYKCKYTLHLKHHFCSKKCFYKFRLKKIKDKCNFCKIIIYKSLIDYELHENHFCSKECANKFQGRNKISFICKNCKKKFFRSKSTIYHFCSWKCCKEFRSKFRKFKTKKEYQAWWHYWKRILDKNPLKISFLTKDLFKTMYMLYQQNKITKKGKLNECKIIK